MDYDGMSDIAIDRKVFTHFFGDGDKDMERVWKQNKYRPCSDAGVSWPIMIDNNIFITATREDHEFKYMTRCLINGSSGLGWSAKFTAYSDNPLRAAMISFLKIKELAK